MFGVESAAQVGPSCDDIEDEWLRISKLWVDELVHEAPPPPPKIVVKFGNGTTLRVMPNEKGLWPDIPLRLEPSASATSWLMMGHSRRHLPTGVTITLPEGCVGFIIPNGQPALHNPVSVETTCLVKGWDKEVMVVVHNMQGEAVKVPCGVVMARVVIVPLIRLDGLIKI